MELKIKKLNDGAIIPTKNHDAAGMDLYALEDVFIEPGSKVIVPTGIAVALPKGTFAQVVGRSGISAKTGLNVITGTIDNDYRGPIGVIVHNTKSNENYRVNWVFGTDNSNVSIDVMDMKPHGTYLVRKGDRIAQMVVHVQPEVDVLEVDDLDETNRGESGFGSSGVR
jgi:putative deoxyuridine 5'-triphosphate nucleotidohydrolase